MPPQDVKDKYAFKIPARYPLEVEGEEHPTKGLSNADLYPLLLALL